MSEGFSAVLFRNKPLIIGSGYVDAIFSEKNEHFGGTNIAIFHSDPNAPIIPQLEQFRSNNFHSFDELHSILVSQSDWTKYEGEVQPISAIV